MSDGTGPGVNIGNYKGVMLCNRPFHGVSAPAKASSSTSGSRPPFVTGGSNKVLGQNVPILNEAMHVQKRDKTNSVLYKHKKWLSDLKKERERLENALFEEEREKEVRRKRFTEREARMRATIRQEQDDAVPETNDFDDSAQRKRPSKKPMWAMTKETAEEEIELKEDEDVDNLVEFANSLDIDDFMGKVEMQAMMEQVNQRMSKLQAEVDDEEEEVRREEWKEQRAEAKLEALNAENLAKLGSDEKSERKGDDDALSMATTVLSECKSIRSVHSTRSLAVLTQRAKTKLDTVPEIVNPKIVTHIEEDGSRISKKNDPNNLPYMHRNPAI